jgi:hypothetical protein
MATIVQPFASRSTITEGPEGLSISIPPQRSWAILFMLAWLGGWTVGGFAAGSSLFHRFSFFVLFWMGGWAFGEIAVGYIVLYTLAGQEVIVASMDALTIKTQIFGFGRGKSFLVRDMRNLRYQAPFTVGGRNRASGIAFDYGARTVMFAAGLDEREATDLVTRIKQWCPVADATSQSAGIKFFQK